DLALEERAGRLDRIVARLWVARAVGQKDAVRIELEYVLGGRLSRHDRNTAAAISQQTQDVVFHAEIVRDHVELVLVGRGEALAHLPGTLFPVERVFGGNDLGEVLAGHTGKASRQFDGALGVVANQNAGALRPAVTQNT